MASSYITLIQDFCAKKGLPFFSGIVGNSDATARQLLALSHEVLEQMQHVPWNRQVLRKTWTGVVGEDQGTLESVFGAGYRAMVPKTLWSNTDRRPIPGAMTDEAYQYFKNLAVGGSLYQYKILGGHLLIVPGPTTALSLSALYVTEYTVLANDGVTSKARITADSDTFVFTDDVFKLQLEWRWLKERGEAWVQTRAFAENAVAQDMNKDGWMPDLSFESEGGGIKPGIFVPAGSWTL